MDSAAAAEPPKIVYVINHLAWFWSHRLPLARRVRQLGWEVVVAAPGASDDPPLHAQGFRGADVASSGRGRAVTAFVGNIWQVKRLIERERPTLLHAVTLKSGLPAALAARWSRATTTTVVTIAGLGYLFCSSEAKARWARRLLIPVIRYALDRENVWIIFQNTADWRTLEECGAVRAQRSVLISGSGVSLAEFPHETEPADGPPVVLMASRMVKEKGIAVFTEAARLLEAEGHTARFVLAGGLDHTNPSALGADEIRALAAAGGVAWLGHVGDLAALYAGCALFVYPSYYGEGVPKVLLEAAASGRPIVTTDHRGCRDVVDDQVNGVLVPIRDPRATADAIARLLSDAGLRSTMGERSRQRAVREFDVEIIVDRTVDLYRRALAAAATRPVGQWAPPVSAEPPR